MSMETTKIIQEQLGHKCLYMLGAYNLVGSSTEDFLSFKIKGSKNVNYIKISLTSMDLYKMEFGKIGRLTAKGVNYKIVKELDGIYADQLHELIEKYTGLYTKLF